MVLHIDNENGSDAIRLDGGRDLVKLWHSHTKIIFPGRGFGFGLYCCMQTGKGTNRERLQSHKNNWHRIEESS